MKPIIKMQKSSIRKQNGIQFGALNASYVERKKWYLSDRWRNLRESFLKEHPYCGVCGEQGKSEFAIIVDHVEGHNPDTWKENFFIGPFQALCWSCHSRKTMLEDAKRKKTRLSASDRKKVMDELHLHI